MPEKNPHPIHGITPFTMLDFPQRTACIIWFAGCNMRCGYCHNPQIVRSKGLVSTDDALAFLKKRQGLLDGVVLSGGEATLSPALPDFIKKARALGYAIKLDTNGTRPDVMERLLADRLLDYVALDYKAPAAKFKALTRHTDFATFSKTLDLLGASHAPPFEVRTTVHTDLLNEQDMNGIIHDLEQRGYQGIYILQNYFSTDERPTLKNMPDQSRLLDTTLLAHPVGYRIETRNFPTSSYSAVS